MRDIEDPQSVPVFEGKIRIGDAVLHSRRNELTVAGETRVLEPRLVRLLATLAAARGEPVSRESLLAAVSNLPYAGDEALTQAMSKLRQALGDTPKAPRYIKTIPRKGYALIAPVTAMDETPATQSATAPDKTPLQKPGVIHLPLVLGLAVLLLTALVAWLVLNPQKWERVTELLVSGDQQFEEKKAQEFIEKKDAEQPRPAEQKPEG